IRITRQGFVETVHAGESDAEIRIGLGVIRLQPQSVAIAGDGVVVSALPQVSIGEVVMGFREVGPKLQGLLMTGNGVVVAPLLYKDRAQVVVGLRMVRLQPDRLA